MPRFSRAFGLTNSQAELDFVDVELDGDTPLYLDPYAIQLKQDDWSYRCIGQIRSFFEELLSAIRDNNLTRAAHLLQNLHEPNETRLGVSKGRPRGRAIGENKARSLAGAMRRSRAFTTGMISDISEAELFVKYVGPDTISDLVTNVVREILAEYTESQCEIYGISTSNVNTLGPIWNRVTRDWEAKTLSLPTFSNSPIVLVPKFTVRRSLALNSQEFYNFHMTEFLQREYLSAGGALVQTLKDGTPYVTKKDVQAIHPLIKDDLARFVIDHPEILESYKRMKGAEGPLSNSELARVLEVGYFDETIFSRALIDRLQAIPAGNPTASEYHSIMLGICTFIFYPRLSCPIKEHEIHHGRKRIDIKYTNSATVGFFHRMLQSPNTRSIDISIECKNYVKEIANPELDQLAGRFSLHRGRFGILLCRSMDNRDRFIDRCRDTVADNRGYIIVLSDDDVIHMLECIERRSRSEIDRFLQKRFDEIV